MIERRSFLLGIGALIAAPAIVRAASLMPVRAPKLIIPVFDMPPQHPNCRCVGEVISISAMDGATIEAFLEIHNQRIFDEIAQANRAPFSMSYHR